MRHTVKSTSNQTVKIFTYSVLISFSFLRSTSKSVEASISIVFLFFTFVPSHSNPFFTLFLTSSFPQFCRSKCKIFVNAFDYLSIWKICFSLYIVCVCKHHRHACIYPNTHTHSIAVWMFASRPDFFQGWIELFVYDIMIHWHLIQGNRTNTTASMLTNTYIGKALERRKKNWNVRPKYWQAGMRFIFRFK